jgi:hypothetical protein
MPNTYTELRSTVVGTATSSVTLDLTSISGYTDLVLVMSVTPDSSSFNPIVKVGNTTIDTGSNYSQTFLSGTGSVANSLRTTSSTGLQAYINAATTNISTIVVNLQNYSNTTTYKTFLIRSNGSGETTASVGLWRSTVAINQIQISAGVNFATGSTFSLYGIANADQGAAKATGGIITEDSQYWYHTFGASSAFIPKQSLTCDILQVAGGGSGGNFNAGGGGAGGLLTYTSQSLTAISYNVTVGAGGAGTTSGGATSNGTNSQFAALTASVGGGGGGWFTGGASLAGQNGGCGGGGMGGAGSSSLLVGTGSQGFNGGTGSSSGSGNGGGGGGGMGAVGGNATNGADTGGNGGAGVTSTLINEIGAVTGVGFNSSGTYYLAGGGGGGGYNAAGAGGIGGGGIGGLQSVAGGNGQVTTGSGGGGARNGSALSGSGGSGVVIVRYAK